MKKTELPRERKTLYAGIFIGGAVTMITAGVITAFKPDLNGVLLIFLQAAVFFGVGYGLGRLKGYTDTYRRGYSDGRRRGKEENTCILQMKVENRSVIFPEGKEYRV